MKKYCLLFCCFLSAAASDSTYHSPDLGPFYYHILGVTTDCIQEDIKTGYRRMSSAFHSDHNKAPGADDAMKTINRAYEILKDPISRVRYDAWLKSVEYQNEFNNRSDRTTQG